MDPLTRTWHASLRGDTARQVRVQALHWHRARELAAAALGTGCLDAVEVWPVAETAQARAA